MVRETLASSVERGMPLPAREKRSAEKPQTFFITVKKFGKGANARWMVDYFAPYAPPVVPDALTD